MGFYNYHGVAMRLIKDGHCKGAELVESYGKISPALVLYFDNHRPMPIRAEKFELYFSALNNFDVPIFTKTIND